MERITQEQKDRWIADMLSGNFKKGETELYDPGTGCYCALGVLATQFPELIIDDNGNLLYKGKNCGYEPFHELLGGEVTAQVYMKNDSVVWLKNGRESFNDFREVAQWVKENVEVEA